MSTNSMHRIAELEARVAALTSENEALAARKNGHPPPNPEELAEAIGTRLERVEKSLREDFVGKFAANFLLAVETITKRVVDAEEKQASIERRLVTHKAEISKMLEESNEKQLGTLRSLKAAIKEHSDKNEATLESQQEAVAACEEAARATADAAALCLGFKQDYEETARGAKLAVAEAGNQARREIGEFTRGLQEEAEAAVAPAIRQLRRLSESQLEWRVKWSIVGFATCIIVSAAVSWLASPTPYVMLDAARWRNWQANNFTRPQADRLNAVLKQIEEENAKRSAGETE
jgi:hypothetical protein